ncbi:unnamed protein product [Rangifer tarandus platyrhynchus]|uniref:Uncharacterized protein n=1 Tax=Rangifer tarandus platyrhynchus TaxID=3082113 RepID=A0AC60A1V5_RANTA
MTREKRGSVLTEKVGEGCVGKLAAGEAWEDLHLISWERKVVTSISASYPRRRDVGQRRTLSAGTTWGGRAGNGPCVSRALQRI